MVGTSGDLADRLRAFGVAASISLGGISSASAQQVVHFPSLDGDIAGGKPSLLDGYLFKPEGSERHPALVFLHGCSGLVDRNGRIKSRERDWARRLIQQDFAVLMVDSFTSRGQGSECGTGGRPVTPQRDRPRDAYGALLFLQSEPLIRADRIALIGWSHGGGSVLYAIRVDSPGRPATLPDGDFRVAVAFYPGPCSERSQGTSWASMVPLLALVGAADNWTPAEPCRRFVAGAVARGAAVEMQVYAGAYHDFDWPNLPVRELSTLRRANGWAPITGMDPAARQDALARVPEFLDRYLKD